MKTYAESQAKKPFNWYTYLDKLIANKTDIVKEEKNPSSPFMKEFHKRVGDAYNWTTCACGNMCDIIDREEDGAPSDSKLYDLGVEFPEVLEDGNWKMARKILDKIEARSAILIQQKITDITKSLKSIGYTVVPLPKTPTKITKNKIKK